MGSLSAGQKKKNSALSKMTGFEFCVIACYFVGALEGLSAVTSTGAANLLVELFGLACDFLLFVVYLTKVKDLKGAVVFVAVALLGIASVWHSKSFLLIKGLLLIVGAKGEDYPKLLRSGAMAVCSVLIIGVICQVFGVPSSDFRRGGLSFGFAHPNEAALFAALMLLLIYTSNSIRGVSQKKDWYFWILGLTLIILTGSRTALAAVILVVCLTHFVKNRFEARRNNGVRVTFLCVPFALTAFSIISAQLLFESVFFQKLDVILSNRIWLNWFAINTFDISAFGQASSLHVEGVHNELRDTWNITTTVDCTYIAALISYGVVGVSAWLISYALAFERAWNARKAAIVAVLVVFAFYAFSESQLTNVLINFGLLCITPILGREEEESSLNASNDANDGT